MVTRAEIEQAKQEVVGARTQIGESREQIQTSRQRIAEELSKLKPVKRVPFTPRRERAATIQYKKRLGITGAELTEAEKQIAEQEQDILKYEKEVLLPADASLKEIEEYNTAVKRIERAAEKGMVWAQAAYGTGLVRKLAKKWLKRRSLAKQDFRKQIQEFESQNPSEKLIVNWKDMKITGVESGVLKQSLSLRDYNKKIGEVSKAYSAYEPLIKKPVSYSKLTSRGALPSFDPSLYPELQKKESYVPSLDAFISPSEPSGQATGFIRPPTFKEAEEISKAQIRGSKKFVESLFLPASLINEPLLIKSEKDIERIPKLLEESKFGIAGGKKSIKALEELAKISKEARERKYLKEGEYITSVGEILRKSGKKARALELGLQFGVKAAEAEAAILAFQLGGAALGAAGMVPKITGTAKQLATLGKVSKASTGILFPSFGALSGAKVYQLTGDPYSGLAAGAGTTVGLFAGSYSKDIINTLKRSTIDNLKVIGKKGSVVPSQQSQYADEVVEVMYKGKKVKMTLSEAKRLGLQPMSRVQATGEFGRASQERQLKILKLAFKDRVYLDKQSLQADIIKAAKFMKQSGLSDAQVKALLFKLFPKTTQASTVVVEESIGQVQKQVTQQVQRQIQKQVQDQMSALLTIPSQTQAQAQKIRQKQEQQQQQQQVQDQGLVPFVTVDYVQPPAQKQPSRSRQIPNLLVPTPSAPAVPSPVQRVITPSRPAPTAKTPRPIKVEEIFELTYKPKKMRYRRPSKKKKKKKKKKVLPTLTQQLIGYKGKRPVDYVTGFEAIRII